MATLLKEYKTINEIAGPLFFLEGISGAGVY